MNRKIEFSKIGLWALLAVLLVSLVGNCIQYGRAYDDKMIPLQGFYSSDAGAGNGPYFAFDSKGHFCMYRQDQGVLEEGNYTEYGKNLYKLESTAGRCSSILLADEGVYYSSGDGILVHYLKTNDVPVFVGDWVKNWEHWPEGTYETKGNA